MLATFVNVQLIAWAAELWPRHKPSTHPERRGQCMACRFYTIMDYPAPEYDGG